MSNLIVTHFNSGVVTPQVDARSDIEKYPGACRICNNMIPDLYGNATRRPGTELIQISNGAACYFEPVVPDPAKIQISTPQELQDMENDLTEDYELVNNIDLDGFDWTPVGSTASKFTGSLDGNFFTISNLTYTSTDNYMGLFGRAQFATLENIMLEDVELHGDFQIGALAGSAESCAITLCGSTGNIDTNQNVTSGGFLGGLIGEASETFGSRGLIQKCWSTVDITVNWVKPAFDSKVGGLIGDFGGEQLQDCWAGGNIILSAGAQADPTWNQWAFASGGLIGRAQMAFDFDINRCFSYTKVLTSTNDVTQQIGGFIGFGSNEDYSTTYNYWDTDVSTIDVGVQGINEDGINGKTTAKMYQEATFETFDFSDVWEIDENADYPRHQWQRLADIKQVCFPL